MPRRVEIEPPRQPGPLEILWGYVWRFALGTWLTWQAIGFFFWALFHFTPVGFREFMFRVYIDYWDRWDTFIMFDLTPSWLQWIWSLPTWQSPIGWILIAFAAYRLVRRFRPPQPRRSV